MKAISIFLVLLASSTVPEQLDVALWKVKAKDYDGAIDRTKPLLDQLRLDTVEQIIVAHKILGVSYCELGDQEKATEHFKTLILFSPNESLEDLPRTRPCKELYLRVQGKPIPVPKAPVVASSPEPKAIVAPVPPPPKPDERWRRFVPFGVGQFANHDTAKGLAFFSTEIAATGLAATSYILYTGDQRPDGTFENPGKASVFRGLFWGSVGVGSVAVVWGIIDAVRTYDHRKTEPKTARFTWLGDRVAGTF